MPVTRRLLHLRQFPLLRRFSSAAAASGQRTWLTGGCIRDLLLGSRATPEFDLAVEYPPELFHRLRLEAGESVFLLDADRQTYRFVARPASRLAHIDVTKFRGGSIEEDLLCRDFTVNALAFDLTPRAPATILDPTGGLADVAARRLRPCAAESLRDDPLRTIRGVRLAVGLGFRLPPSALAAIDRARPGLARVSGERLRDELFRILQGPAPSRGAGQLLRLGLLESVAPFFRTAPPPLRALRRVETLLEAIPPRSALALRLAESLEQGVERRGVLLLAALLLDAGGKGRPERVVSRLVLGKRAAVILQGVLRSPLSPRWLRKPGEVARGELLVFFRQCDAFADEAAVLGAALLDPSVEGRDAARAFLGGYRRARRAFLRAPILRGEEIMEIFGIPPGPALGELLRRGKEAQDLGSFRDGEGAVRWAREWLAGGREPGGYRDGRRSAAD